MNTLTDDAMNQVVLVVDDSPDSLGMLNTALSEADFTVLVALSGRQALSIIDKVKPDIILLDAVMPELDGFQTCRILKQQLPETPIIFMTGLTESEHIVAGFEAGGIDYVTKPIKPVEVIARIGAHINNAKLTSSARAALDTTGQHTLAIDSLGNILWMTDQTRQLLQQIATGKPAEQGFTRALSDWLSQAPGTADLIFQEFSQVIRVSYIDRHGDQEHLIKIDTQQAEPSAAVLQEKLPITRREAEVLLWLSVGKTNWEIAQILQISPRTVNKHLEQIFRKLEVENRTAAATIAIRAISA